MKPSRCNFVDLFLYLYFPQDNYWDVGHFTDVVWSDVTEVGAAIYYCPSDGRNYLAFCSSSSNVQGQWGHNVNCPQDWQGYTGSLACNTC